MNPKGFNTRENTTPDQAAEIATTSYLKADLDESWINVRYEDDVLAELRETYKQLMKDKDEPLLVFDTCLHTGNSLLPVKQALTQVGFSDVRIGSVNPSDPDSKVKTDFFITKQVPTRHCYPFDNDRLIEKTFDHVYSYPTSHSQNRARSIRLRKEIKKIIEDFLAVDQAANSNNIPK